MSISRHIPAISLALALWVLAPSAMAASAQVQGAVQLAQGGCTSLDQAVEQVRRQYNGRIVSAETRVSGKREVHYIKVLTDDGKVKTVTVPGCPVGNG
ncbi:MAG: hypothetical protein RLN69_15520 [Woeseiaceae bacterium]